MRNSSAFIEHIVELLAPAGQVSVKRMFGGHGVYLDGLFIAIVADDELYLKCDEASRAAFDAEDCAPFTYSRNGAPASLNFRRAPGKAMDAPHLMLPWARHALQAALRARAAKGASKSGAAASRKNKTAAKTESSRPKGKKRRA